MATPTPHYCTRCGNIEHLEPLHRTMYLCPSPCHSPMTRVTCYCCEYLDVRDCALTAEHLPAAPELCSCGDWTPPPSWTAALPHPEEAQA